MARDSAPFAALLAAISAEVRGRRPPAGMATKVVAVDGLGGAGKSSFAERLAAALDGAEIVHTDDFATWDNPLDWWPDLIKCVLIPLATNRPVRFERSRWGGEDRGWAELQPGEFVILEGVTASRDAFRPYLTYAIWIEAPEELRLRRGLDRDGDDAREKWRDWMALEERYRISERPDEWADKFVRGDLNLWT